ncbi:unnamed protein product [Penicillium nalgiovense]|nr:unnamed protein product [Penicillium nalgiovense]CAG8214655.1 unnamed protein product [Penicillium nalgiovense]
MCRFSLATILWDWWQDADIGISIVNENEESLITISAKVGCLPICEKLLDRGADVNA